MVSPVIRYGYYNSEISTCHHANISPPPPLLKWKNIPEACQTVADI